jgi:hypothetical protein
MMNTYFEVFSKPLNLTGFYLPPKLFEVSSRELRGTLKGDSKLGDAL